MGFGAVCPQPSLARASARRMWTASFSVASAAALVIDVALEAQPETEGTVELRAIRARPLERVVGVDLSAARLTALEHDLEERQVQRQVRERVRAGHILFRIRNARLTRREPTRRLNRRRNIGRLLVAVLTHAGRDPEH